MQKQIALAYGIAGIAVAVALVATLGGNEPGAAAPGPSLEITGGPALEPRPERPALEPTPPASEPDNGSGAGDTAAPSPDSADSAQAPVEYVYVDEPARARRGHHDDDDDDGDDDDHESHDDHERREHDRGERE